MWYLIILLLSSCMPQMDFLESKSNSALSLSVSNRHYNIYQKKLKLNLVVLSGDGSKKELEKSLFLLKDPRDKINPDTSELVKIKTYLSKGKRKNTYTLFSKEILDKESVYGLYKKNAISSELIYVFRVVDKAPKLLSHDLGVDKEKLTVSSNRIYFSFSFDQLIRVIDQDAVKIINKISSNELTINNIVIMPDEKSFRVTISDKLSFGQEYSVLFGDGIVNNHGIRADIDQLDFYASYDANKFSINQISLSASANAVEFDALVNNQGSSWFYLFDSDRESTALFLPAQKNNNDYRYSFFWPLLKEDHDYRFLFKARDNHGDVLISSGVFHTPKEILLRISEIMVNPKEIRENEGEFIEIVNLDTKPIDLNRIFLSIEDRLSKKSTTCSLEVDINGTFIYPNEYALLVSNSFNAKHYSIDPQVSIIRFKRKTLCGGLSNSSPKIIKLHERDGNFIDRFYSKLYYSKEGRSVERINLLGLEEQSNYCYSNTEKGPTPGRANNIIK